MHHPIADILRVFQGRDHGEHPLLLPELQMGLEPYQVVDGARGVVLAQLHYRVGLPAGPGVLEAPGLQRAVPQGILPPAGHDLHGHAALKDVLVLKAVDLRLLGFTQLPPERPVGLLVQGAVDVVRGALVVPGGKPGAVHVDALKGHQGGGGVKKVEGRPLPKEGRELLRQGVAGEGASGNDHLPFCGELRHLPLHHLDARMGADGLCNVLGEGVAVHRQGPASLHTGGVRRLQDQAPQAAQFLLQKAHCVLQPCPPQGVGAHQLRKV